MIDFVHEYRSGRGRRLVGVDCHALDLRGHGDTPAPDADYAFPWPAFGTDVLAAVDILHARGAVGAGGLVGIGHSCGGAALVLAEAARPGTFRTLWLYEPAAFPPPEPGHIPLNPLAEPTKRRRPTFASREEAAANFASKPPMAAFDPEVLAEYVGHGFTDHGDHVALKCRPAHEARVYEAALTTEVFDAMAEVRCPVLVARGRDGGSRLHERLAARFPDATLESHDDLDHFGPLTHPERAVASISAWLGTMKVQ